MTKFTKPCRNLTSAWTASRATPWGFQPPISIGLMCSGVYTIANEALTGWRSALIALIVGVLLLRSKINPVLLIFVAAAASYFL